MAVALWMLMGARCEEPGRGVELMVAWLLMPRLITFRLEYEEMLVACWGAQLAAESNMDQEGGLLLGHRVLAHDEAFGSHHMNYHSAGSGSVRIRHPRLRFKRPLADETDGLTPCDPEPFLTSCGARWIAAFHANRHVLLSSDKR